MSKSPTLWMLVWILSTLCVRAQSPDRPVIRVDVRQVIVPVIVTDSKGHHVTGLKASDFRILEDGEPQQVVAFSADAAASEDTLAGTVPRPVSSSAPQPAGHTYVIALDALHCSFADSARTRDALTRLFEREKASDARYVLLSIGRQLQMIQTATADPAALFSKLRNPKLQAALGGPDAAQLRSELNELKNRMYDFCKGCNCSTARECNMQAQDLKTGLDGQAEHWGMAGEQFLLQLKSVVEELGKLSGEKILVLVSDGFSLQPAREFYSVVTPFLPKDERFQGPGPIDLEPKLQGVIKAASVHNIRIYSVDSRGLEQSSFSGSGSMDASTPSDRSAPSVIRHTPPANRGGTLFSGMDSEAGSVAFQNGAGMAQLAQATGGIYFENSNDLLKQFRSVLADGRERYLLAYVPKSREPDGKFRKITVEVADKRLQVRAKTGYWPEPSTAQQ